MNTETAIKQFSEIYQQTGFENLEGWDAEDHLAALSCFGVSAERMRIKPYTTKAFGTDAEQLAKIGDIALALLAKGNLSDLAARKFFENHFIPFSQRTPFSGFVTGYYEPEVEASLIRTEEFSSPIYSRPDDLIDIDPKNPPKGLPEGYAFARKTSHGPVPYFDRREIENGAIANQGLELFWLKDPVDVYFIHIQGSARLILPDGTLKRISYAAKAGHPFTAVGKVMVERGIMPLEDVTMQSIRHYLASNPDEAPDLMQQNRSFIFFQEVANANPDLGPVAAASVALTPGRSLAVDRKLHTFGTPVFVQTKSPLPGSTKPMQRLMMAQDTGSAIVGPARGDLFIGSGAEAGEIAGAVKHDAGFTIFRPKKV